MVFTSFGISEEVMKALHSLHLQPQLINQLKKKICSGAYTDGKKFQIQEDSTLKLLRDK